MKKGVLVLGLALVLFLFLSLEIASAGICAAHCNFPVDGSDRHDCAKDVGQCMRCAGSDACWDSNDAGKGACYDTDKGNIRLGYGGNPVPCPAGCVPLADHRCNTCDDGFCDGSSDCSSDCCTPTTEICNGLDDNCVGGVDEGGICAKVNATYWA